MDHEWGINWVDIETDMVLGKMARAPARFKVPFSGIDLETGVFEKFVYAIGCYHSMRRLDELSLPDIVARAMGYESANNLKTSPAIFSRNEMPEHQLDLFYYVAWRLSRTAGVPLADSVSATLLAFIHVPLVAVLQYESRSSMDTEERGWNVFGGRTLPSVKRHEVFDRRAALREDGMLFVKERIFMAKELIRRFAPDDEYSQIKLLEDADRDAWVPLRDAISAGVDAHPPGLRLVSFSDMYGGLVGYGYFCAELNGYMKVVIRPEAEVLTDVAESLWLRQPLPAGAALPQLPGTLFVDFTPPRLSPIKPYEWVRHSDDELSARARADIEPRHQEAVSTLNGLIGLGRDVDIDGVTFSMTSREHDVDEFEGLLGLQLDELDPDTEDAFHWFGSKVPTSFSRATFETVVRVIDTMEKLAKKEDSWIADRRNHPELRHMAKTTSGLLLAVEAQNSSHYKQGNLGFVANVEVPEAGDKVAAMYPELTAIRRDTLGDYGLDFWTKDGLRHEGRPTHFEPEFLGYAVLRNLGLDPKSGNGETSRRWSSVFRLVRLTTSASTTESEWEEVARQARKLSLAYLSAAEMIDDFDTSAGEDRVRKTDRERIDGIVEFAGEKSLDYLRRCQDEC